MLKAKNKLIGKIENKATSKGRLNNAIIYVKPELENLRVKPTTKEQVFNHPNSYGYDVVTVEASDKTINLQDKNVKITKAGTQKIVADENFDGLNEVSVSVYGEELHIEPTDEEQNFDGLYGNVVVNPIIAEGLELTPSMEEQNFSGLYNSVKLNRIESKMLTVIPKYYEQTSSGLYSLVKVKGVEITDAGMLFYDDYRLDIMNEILNLLSPNCTSFYRMFSGCDTLTEVPELNGGSSVYAYQMFDGCINLTKMGGIKDLGKAYLTSVSANYARYTLDVSSAEDLTYESIINIFNGLYDIKSKGCKLQRLIIGPKYIEKVSSEELLIPTNKGWTVS